MSRRPLHADEAHLVEHLPSKQGVAGSRPVIRSLPSPPSWQPGLYPGFAG